MNKFIKIPSHFIIPNRKGYWLSDGDLEFYSETLDCVIIIPAGDITNLASIPVFFRRMFNVNGSSRLAAVLHDGIYTRQGLVMTRSKDGQIEEIRISRESADLIFKQAMRINNESLLSAYPERVITRMQELDIIKDFYKKQQMVGEWTAWAMYNAVRIGGKKAWENNKL